MSQRPKIAAIITEYRPLSHADVIVTKFLKGFPTDEGVVPSRCDVVSMYIDQFPEADVGRAIAEEHGVPIYPSIVKALTLGGDTLAVDGVLLIGEHGDYAWNEKEQHLFPRKYFMEQICGVFATSKRSVPVFNDKHLSYNWHDMKWMVDRARFLGVPFMGGSSAPLGHRSPYLEYEPGVRIEDAVAVSFSGLDIYGYHCLDLLQTMVERRSGGETGVAAVQCLEGDAVWEAAKAGLWSREMAEAACAPIRNKPAGSMEEHCKNPALFLVEYRDGLRAAGLLLNGYVSDFGFAARIDGEVQSAEFYLHGPPHPHFSYLSLNIEEMFVTGEPQWPIERTLLASAVLEAALTSRHEGYVRVETPYLDVSYTPARTPVWRPVLPRPAGPAAGVGAG
ncbi:MAG: hypothetical protein AUJ92_08070 [Armatimonadetes bacterium CG2_30_59_28]|nr:MAG: hypothetical protein AUJ92_08070 [Armatimonadetes bacterium CG2_30_59_28]